MHFPASYSIPKMTNMVLVVRKPSTVALLSLPKEIVSQSYFVIYTQIRHSVTLRYFQMNVVKLMRPSIFVLSLTTLPINLVFNVHNCLSTVPYAPALSSLLLTSLTLLKRLKVVGQVFKACPTIYAVHSIMLNMCLHFCMTTQPAPYQPCKIFILPKTFANTRLSHLRQSLLWSRLG